MICQDAYERFLREKLSLVPTNPGDVVLSPFAGIGSEGYVSLQMGRQFVGIELKGSYYEQARLNLGMALSQSALRRARHALRDRVDEIDLQQWEEEAA